jgi:hypothetical protein
VIQKHYCKSNKSYFLALLRLYVYRYLIYCIYVWQSINEVLINYDRYLVFSNKKNLFNRNNSFKIILFSTGLSSFLLFVPNLFAYQISLDPNEKDNYDYYYISKTKFGNTYLFQLYLFFMLGASNIFSTLFLIITSIKLVLEARNFCRNSIIQNNSYNYQTVNSRKIKERNKIDMNIFKLVLIMSIIFTLVRLNDFVYSLYDSLFVLNFVSDEL